MSDPEPSLTFASALSTIFRSIGAVLGALVRIPWSRCLAWLVHLVALPLKLVAIPLAWIARVLLIVLAPAVYIVSFAASGVRATFAFLALLEPLYTFFSVAAAVGIMAGIAVGVSSSVLTSYLGMQGEDEEDTAARGAKQKYYLQSSGKGWDSSSTTELDWQWLDSSSQRRRPASGLLSQTIHEEDDDSEY